MRRAHTKPPIGPSQVSARLWDVAWEEGGIGKHGGGPFATESQARACIARIGWAGTPVLGLWTLDPARLARIVSKLKTGLPGRAQPGLSAEG